MRILLRTSIVVVCVLGALALAVSSWLAIGTVRTQDRNHDGQTDAWLFYDARGELVRIATDTNSDGRCDELDYYSHGALIRRELDRNLDHRADLVEGFDEATHEPVRLVSDRDFNGVADILVLFQGGVPVATEDLEASAGSSPAARSEVASASDDPTLPFAPLFDPSRSEAFITSIDQFSPSEGGVAFLVSLALPQRRFELLRHATVSRAGRFSAADLIWADVSPRTARGPPASQLL